MMNKYSALLSLEAYETDEASSSDQEETEHGNLKNSSCSNSSSSRIKEEENATNLLSDGKQTSEAKNLLDIPVSAIPLPPTCHEVLIPTTTSREGNFLIEEKLNTPSSKRNYSVKSEVFTTPTSSMSQDRSTAKESSSKLDSALKRFLSTSIKRTYSMTEEDDVGDNKNGFQKTRDQKSFSASNSPASTRRSFPSKQNSRLSLPQMDTPKRKYDDGFGSRSLPSKNSDFRNYRRVCATDQTPYSPSDQRHKRMRTELPYYNSSDLVTFKSEGGFIDSHCHLDFLFQRNYFKGSFKDFRDENSDTFPECFKGCLAIFCNPFTFKKKHIWENFLEEENVWASFGCHPHNAKDYNDDMEEDLRLALEHPKVRALGEIGLDYSNRNQCQKEKQHEVFRRQLKITLEKKLPLVLHCREAFEDAFSIMREIMPKDYSIHLHCFTDVWDVASQWLQEFPRLYIGLTNVVTFPSASSVHEVAKKIPLNRLLLETDTPYFVPKPLSREYPGMKFSHPGMAIHVAAQVASLKGVPLELVLDMTRQNTKNLYKI